MKRPLLAAVALLLSLPAAAGRCPRGGEPIFTGSPFRPLECPQPGSAAQVSTAPAAPIAAKGSKLNDLVGRWEGYASFGIERFETLFILEKSGLLGKNLSARFETREHRTLIKETLSAQLKAQGPGEYAAAVRLEEAPSSALSAKVTLGKSEDPAFDRELLLVYENGKTHRLRLKRDNETLRYFYEDLSLPDLPPSRGTLTRSQRGSL